MWLFQRVEMEGPDLKSPTFFRVSLTAPQVAEYSKGTLYNEDHEQKVPFSKDPRPHGSYIPETPTAAQPTWCWDFLQLHPSLNPIHIHESSWPQLECAYDWPRIHRSSDRLHHGPQYKRSMCSWACSNPHRAVVCTSAIRMYTCLYLCLCCKNMYVLQRVDTTTCISLSHHFRQKSRWSCVLVGVSVWGAMTGCFSCMYRFYTAVQWSNATLCRAPVSDIPAPISTFKIARLAPEPGLNKRSRISSRISFSYLLVYITKIFVILQQAIVLCAQASR